MHDLVPVRRPIERMTAGRDTIRPAVGLLPVSSPGWLRQRRLEWGARRLEREARKAEAAHQRLVARMDTIGDQWRVLDLKVAVGVDRSSFLTVGPGGVFVVTVKDHGRSRISFAGDVVQVDGRRPRHVAEARATAQFAADALSGRAGVSIPVMPVLAFAGSGMIAFHGLPKGCIVTSYQDLDQVLAARGRRIAQATVEKVYAVATDPETWTNNSRTALADRYRWYPEGE